MTYLLRRATERDIPIVAQWRAEAAAWIEERYGSDQWKKPLRTRRRLTSINAGEMWMAHRDTLDTPPVATITLDHHANKRLWTADEQQESAWYVHKLIVPRDPASPGLGAALLDWAGQQSASEGAWWLRLSAWSTNDRLQRYYTEQGFTLIRIVPNVASGAVFQRPAGHQASGGTIAIETAG